MVRPDRPQRPFRRLSTRRLPLRFGQARRQYAASDAHVYARSQRSALHLPGDAGLRHPRRQIRALRPRRRLGQRHAVAGQVPQPTSADLRNRTARWRPRPPDRVGRTLHRTDRHHGLQEDGGEPLLRRPRQRTLRQGVRRCDDRIPVGSRGGLRSRRTGTAHRQSDWSGTGN